MYYLHSSLSVAKAGVALWFQNGVGSGLFEMKEIEVNVPVT